MIIKSSKAVEFERVICKISGGKQDQYAATFGGFNLMEFFDNNRVVVTPLRIKNWIMCELGSLYFLYFRCLKRF